MLTGKEKTEHEMPPRKVKTDISISFTGKEKIDQFDCQGRARTYDYRGNSAAFYQLNYLAR